RRDRVRDTFKDLLKTFYARDLDTYTKEIEEIAPSAEALVRLVRLFDQVYAEIKRRENVIDFSDIEHMALAILADEAIAEDYRKNIDHIFIDEYQDSNYVQETIVSRITRRGNVFMVGDVKQSIYKFRNAEPAIFLEKLHRFKQEDAEPQDGETVPLSSGLRIDLSANFRSKVGVIAAVNAVFEQVMDARYAGIDYDEDQRLEVGLPCGQEMTRKARLYIAAKDADKAVYANTAESEAAVCAGIIRELLGQDRYDAKADQPRSIEYRDIVILLRSAKGTAETMQKTLEKYGIPAFTDRGEGYFETVEIDTFLGLLKTVINTRRDVPLAAALCSAAFGFDLAELADIRLGKNEGYFYEAFLAYAEGGTDPALREKCRAMILRLAQWRNEERFLPLDEFLWKLMRESGYFDYAGALPHGAQRQANLRGLLDRARDFQKGRVRGLRAFVSYLDRVKKRVAVPQIKLLSEGENVVRILTVHGSKGLEFPVVIQCGLGDSFSKGGFGDGGLLLHREVGLSLQWENRRAHTYKKTLPHHAIRLRREMDERAEDVRLLYVSMTRAMDCLCLVGTVTDPEAVLDLYANTDPDVDTDVPGAKNYLELILPTVCARPDLFDVTALPLDEQALPIGLPHRNPWIPGQARDDKGGAVNRSPQRQLCRIPRRIRIKTSSIKAKKPTFSTRPVFLNNGKALSLNHGGYLSRADAAAAVREAAADHSGYVYPYADEAQLKVKYSVTELTRRDNEAAEAQRTPAAQTKHPSVLTEFTQTKRPPVFTTMQSDHSPVFFFAGSAGETEEDAGLLGQDLTAAEKGTALHKALELLDFKEAYRRCDDLGFFETYLNGLRTIGALTDAEADAVGAERLARFAGSDLCARAARAEFIMKEAPFNMRLPEEGIIVQGVIDLLFREEDGLVVADYKSGHFELGRPGEEERIRETYGGQLALYRRAAEQVFGESVKEALLYMTKSGICIRA
ncbi:MAG: UvrD-helicase domain-containing protein, partial [Clostridiales Family XIII bacterium]|nr:UvrD-helicase domain-containing protein [Clostridiales Family XIII bacterium]